MKDQEIPFGAMCTDKVTKFKGAVTGYIRHLTGCDQVVLTPKSLRGKPGKAEVFDTGRVEQDGFHPKMENRALVADAPIFELGQRVRHLVSGHEGTIVSMAEFWDTDQVDGYVMPDHREDGEQASSWYTIAALEAVEDVEKVEPATVQHKEKTGADPQAVASLRAH